MTYLTRYACIDYQVHLERPAAARRQEMRAADISYHNIVTILASPLIAFTKTSAYRSARSTTRRIELPLSKHGPHCYGPGIQPDPPALKALLPIYGAKFCATSETTYRSRT